MKAPEQAPARNQSEPPKGAEHPRPPDQVQQDRHGAAEPTDAPQQVVTHAQSQAKGQGQEEFPPLGADRQLHQPKSRAKKLPASRALSS